MKHIRIRRTSGGQEQSTIVVRHGVLVRRALCSWHRCYDQAQCQENSLCGAQALSWGGQFALARLAMPQRQRWACHDSVLRPSIRSSLPGGTGIYPYCIRAIGPFGVLGAAWSRGCAALVLAFSPLAPGGWGSLKGHFVASCFGPWAYKASKT
jgi:hypothetical protein